MEQVTTWWWPSLSLSGLPRCQNICRHGETLAHLCHHTGPTHFLWVTSQPVVMWHSPAAPQTLLLQAWAVTSTPDSCLLDCALKATPEHWYPPHFCLFPSWQPINVYHPKEYCTNPLWTPWGCCHTQTLAKWANKWLCKASTSPS